TLTEEEKTDYFAAELCLLAAPAQTGITDAVSRYGDLAGVHAQQSDMPGGNDLWHVTGQSVHRYFVFAHETLLRTECGYTGALPYWNEVVDAGAFAASPVVLNFGGEGAWGNDWAVVDGPFANLTLYLGPGTMNTVHPLTRQVNETQSVQAGQQFVDALLSMDTFAKFKDTMRHGLHAVGHKGVGGEMSNVVTSPNDPLFWLHHGYVDYIWWKWQGDNETRINDLNEIGYETQKEPDTGYVVADVSDTKGGFLCYTYV
ncbi:Di-copper centre-containing protein, partial [Armillaria gallica]